MKKYGPKDHITVDLQAKVSRLLSVLVKVVFVGDPISLARDSINSGLHACEIFPFYVIHVIIPIQNGLLTFYSRGGVVNVLVLFYN